MIGHISFSDVMSVYLAFLFQQIYKEFKNSWLTSEHTLIKVEEFP